ncbi:MAG TPA: LuxR C-terminal-related transcriptional regulator [Streptosporangiaceae bacterium]|nr:LuxR C-terminal-related transcriptional regulator [Streptosporangiaceae bacterium]
MAAHVADQPATHPRRPAVSSGDPILEAKITAPSVPEWAVQRPRITKMIAVSTRSCPLTVVTGPPGAGKTMALALWAAAEPGPVAWVGLDEFDNRPGVFWSYVLAALGRCGVVVPRALRSAVRGREADDGFLLRLAATLADQDPTVTLILDDLHLLTEPQVLKGLDFVLRNSGTGLRLAVSSRMDPLLPLHRYRLTGQLTEIRARDLAFSVAEAGLLLAQHGSTLTAEWLESLTHRTEGWAAGLRLAAISLGTHPDPGRFLTELIIEDSALTGYLVDEVLNAQPPQVRDVLLSTSILKQVSADISVELVGDEQAAGILATLARTNAFVQPIGSGWYRYHTLFAEMLRLKLRHEHPDRVTVLHARAASWYRRNGKLTDAVRHAALIGDWPLAADMVVDGLAIGQLIAPRADQLLAAEFAGMPPGRAWSEPAPHLVAAAMALAAGQHESCAAALEAADRILERLPADQQVTAQLTGAIIRLYVCLRTGDLVAAAAAVIRAELLVSKMPSGMLTRNPDITQRVLAGRGAVELWSGHLDEAARILEAGADAAPPAEYDATGCLGYLALAEALRGRLYRAAELAGQVTHAAGEHRSADDIPAPAALIALAWVYLQRNELRETRLCLKQADSALSVTPDKLIATAAYLVAAGGALAEGRALVAVQIIARARSGGPVPAWLDYQLGLAESRALVAAGDVQGALTAAERAGRGTSLEATVTIAQAWAAAGDGDNAQRALQPALTGGSRVPDRIRMQAWLVDARLNYASGNQAHGRRSLASALRLAEPEQLRLPFTVESSWLGPVLQRDPELTGPHRQLLAPALPHEQLPSTASPPDQAAILVVEPLTEREREVLRHVSGMLNTAEVASEMYISVNTVKTHLRNIYRKLAAAHRSEAVRRARELELI